jgi:hypothetical protein
MGPLAVWENDFDFGGLVVLGFACLGVAFLAGLAGAVALAVIHNRSIRRDESPSDD